MMLKLLLPTALILSSCCGIPQKAILELPDEVVCPEFTNEELKNVSQGTYEKVAELNIICTEDLKTHRDIIKATH